MNKKEFLARLAELDLPKDEFRVLSGGSLLLHGLRERTNDIDLAISQELADELQIQNYPCKNGYIYTFAPDVEMMIDAGRSTYDEVCGYTCEDLQSILVFKRKMMREKDLPDIAKIEEYLEGRRFLELERRLFKVKYMTDAQYLDKTLADDYLECGKSGRLFGKAEVIEELTALTKDRPIEIFNYSAGKMGEVWLIHYVTLNGNDRIYRTSIWTDDGVMKFHQASKLTIDIELEEVK